VAVEGVEGDAKVGVSVAHDGELFFDGHLNR
jgi:hypothetical protein